MSIRYAVTVKKRIPGAKWRRVYVSPKGVLAFSRQHGANRGGLGLAESKRARVWAKRRLLNIRVARISDNPFKAIEGKHGLIRSSGDSEARGVHATGSYHYRVAPWGGVEAYDYGDARNAKANLVAAGNDAKKHAEDWAEVFGPFNFYVKNGVVYQGQFPGHGDHLHLARTKPL